MCITKKKYNKVRFKLTEALRHLELLKAKLEKDRLDTNIYSEVSYWVSSLDLLRNCLYDCEDIYEGKIDLLDSVSEIQSELANSYVVELKNLKKAEVKMIYCAWKNCVNAKGLLE